MNTLRRGRSPIAVAVRGILGFSTCSILCLGVQAQEKPKDSIEEVVVTGFRASLADALDAKRQSVEMVDVINAEDIAKFPDANLAESLQRLPGVSIDRDNGEGRTITVRGLGPDFTTVRLNGMDALSTAGGSESGTSPNRSRGFDFNTFASDLFSSLKVQKTASANVDEGSLGAVIDLDTGRPLNYGRKFAFGADAAYYQNGGKFSPVLSGLASETWFDNTLGALVSAAYSKRDSIVDSYQHNPGQFDFAYRQSQHNGKTPAVFGFAQPGAPPAGVNAGGTYGSDPAAYALLNNTTIIPALGTLSHQDLKYTRLGLTGTLQWKPAAGTMLTADYVYSKYHQDNVSYQLTTIGLNRNGTAATAQNLTLGALNSAAGNTARRAVYVRCDQSATVDCGQTLNGTTLVAGTKFSFNPNNLDPYDYYNATVSPGYIPDPNQIAYYTQLIGRPSTRLMGAHVNSVNQADYLQLDSVDWRSAADGSENDTLFHQFSLNVSQDFGERFHANMLLGQSKSSFDGIGLLTEINSIDRNGFVYDERGGGNMPVFNPGFDVANPANWDLVKGLSTIRFFDYQVDNTFKTGRLEFDFKIDKHLTLNFGGTVRVFEYENSQTRRSQNIEAINPTLREAGLTIGQIGQTVNFGDGLQLAPGTPTSWFAPNMDAFKNYFGINCNCINKWADFRGSADLRQSNTVKETDKSFYLQTAFNYALAGHDLRGNIGVRYAGTKVEGDGVVGAFPVNAENDYHDWLPSLNTSYALLPDLLLRFAAAKTMSRPFLQNLTPGTTSFSTTCTASGPAGSEICQPGSAAPAVTMGNPYLKPFRSTNFDFSVEWYFSPGAVLSAAYFRKDIDSFPQQLLGSGPLSSALQGDTYNQVVQSLITAGTTAGTRALANYTQQGGIWDIRQFRDSPGGLIQGVELTYQQNLTFLPKPWDGFGIIANYTHIRSNLQYIINGDTGASLEAPWLNVSPDAFNATVFYETKRWDARLSGAYRKGYIRTFPIATGTCEVGINTSAGGPCNAPIMADFIGVENTFNLDASVGFQVADYLKLNLQALNLTNQTTNRWAYQAGHEVAAYMSTGRVLLVGVRLAF